ncbi:insulinase family protein [Candidatus Endolissoclinum faulkneri L2]|uniref:Insulinase family protein n=1 Tax=Candidatus Endolissoclinum faulkneri L2 TaxID=1193729 RepID=K7ZC38_9PROT|nr:pitrilysin family protein [Candidatus Endolissoclinum faulkneri]AFX98266.1 insulinase family protein [Candidatus Endolissoclinum faulkneri L2]
MCQLSGEKDSNLKKLSLSNIHLTTLDNKLTVASDAMVSVDTASVGLWIGVGTRHEKLSENGLAHLIEHMLFKGTVKRDAITIAREIENVGGHMNAYTAREQTAYYAKVLSDDLPLAIELLADIVQNSVFDTSELDCERSVIVREIAQINDTPDDVIFDYFQAAAFPNQTLGRSVLGNVEVVRSIERQSLVNYITRMYQAESCVLAVAGLVDHEQLVNIVAKRFNTLPKGTMKEVDFCHYVGGEIRVERELEQLHIILGFRGTSFFDPDFYTIQVLSVIYGGGMSSRLFQEVREKRGLAYSIYSFTSAYLDDGLFGVYLGTGVKEVVDAIPIVCEQLMLIPDTLNESELARAKVQIKSSLLMSRESTSSRSEHLANHFIIHGKVPNLTKIIDNVEAVDQSSIRRMVGRLLKNPPTLTSIGFTKTLEDYDKICARLS